MTELSAAKNFELASTTGLFATRPVNGPPLPPTVEQLQAQLAESHQQANSLEAKLGEQARQITELDRRLNQIRRSRWWRVRRRLLHSVGYEDRKD